MSARSIFAAAALVVGVLASPVATAEGAPVIEEWAVPWADSRPRDPFAAVDGSVWFVGQKAGYAARLDPATGEMVRIELPEGEGAHNIIVGSDGVVWYAGNRTGVIGRIDPDTRAIETTPMPDAAARDPHTLIFDADERHIWFTVQGGNFLGRMNLATRKVDLIPSRTERSRPYGIKLAPDGSVWAVLFGTNRLAHVDPQTLALTEIAIPRAEARPRRLEVGADGRVWYGDYAGGMLGVYDPATETFREWALPSGAGAKPYATAMDGAGRVWVFETGVQPNRLVGFDPASETFFAGADVPSGGGTVRHTHVRDGVIWFGADTNSIGRAIVEPRP